MQDLNKLIGTGVKQSLQVASGINDAGHIVGSGDGAGFILIPNP
jgi:hypothetical protein